MDHTHGARRRRVIGKTPATLPKAAEHGGRIDALARARRRNRHPLRRWMYENGIVLAASLFFALSWWGQAVAGHRKHNEDLAAHGGAPMGFAPYLVSSHFWNATAENWQSEFLQIAMFVVLTAMLRQKGSPESEPLDRATAMDADPRHAPLTRDTPWPVRRGGIALRLYEHSLSLALFLLFAASFLLHAASGARQYALEQRWHGEPPSGFLDFVQAPTFWFEVLQNWQSEFLAVAVFTWLTVYLRERGSAQSKPVAMAHDEIEE